MIIAVLADEDIKAELKEKDLAAGWEYVWVDSVSSLLMTEADCYFDAQFEMDPERTSRLARLLPKPVLISAVDYTLQSIGDPGFIRINGWPGMLSHSVVELAFSDNQFGSVSTVMESLGWQFCRVPDIEGLVTPRIIAMIINEAFFALGEGISSREDIDRAMKQGTNYPYGPFEWLEKIGIGRILSLFISLHKGNSKYEVAPALVESSKRK